MAGFFTGKDLPAIAGKDEPVMVNAGNVPGNILPGFAGSFPGKVAGNILPPISHSCCSILWGSCEHAWHTCNLAVHYSHRPPSILFKGHACSS